MGKSKCACPRALELTLSPTEFLRSRNYTLLTGPERLEEVGSKTKGKEWCPGWESNPHEEKSPEDFKSSASAIPPPGHRSEWRESVYGFRGASTTFTRI